MGPEDTERVTVITARNRFQFGGGHGTFKYRLSMGLTELHLHLEGTVDRQTVMLLDPALSRETVDAAWNFTDFAGFISCFKFVAQRMKGSEDYALVTRRMM